VGVAARPRHSSVKLGNCASVVFAPEIRHRGGGPPNQALKWTAPVASLGVRPLSYYRWADRLRRRW
jgi:hypothetical protein